MTLPKNMLLPARTISQLGASQNLLAEAQAFGKKGLIIYAPSYERSGSLKKLQANTPDGLNVQYLSYVGNVEPTVAILDDMRKKAENLNVDWVAGIGGGSVLDLTKVVAALICAPENTLAYHNAEATFSSGIPLIAVPTTAGTGAEATPAAVFINDDTQIKKPIIHPGQMANLVILDGELLKGAPASLLAHTGMDAFTQAIEAYTSNCTTSLTDSIAENAMRCITNALPSLFKNYDANLAQQVMEGSYLAGVALANAKLGLVHGIAHPLGSRTRIPHGLLCAIFLPLVLEVNKSCIEEKYKKLSKLVGKDIIDYINDMNTSFNISLQIAAETVTDMDQIVIETQNGATKFNPRPVNDQEIKDVIMKIIA